MRIQGCSLETLHALKPRADPQALVKEGRRVSLEYHKTKQPARYNQFNIIYYHEVYSDAENKYEKHYNPPYKNLLYLIQHRCLCNTMSRGVTKYFKTN